MPAVPYDVNASLLRAAACSEKEISTLIGSLTLERTAPSILDEILARCPPPADLAGAVLFELDLGRISVGHTLSFRDGRVEVTRGSAGSPGARISFDAVDLVTALYGPTGRLGGMTRKVEPLLPFPDLGTREGAGELRRAQSALAEIIEIITAACSSRTPHLDELAGRYGTDKWGFLRWFAGHYERHFRPLVDGPVRLLEIGIEGTSGISPATTGTAAAWRPCAGRGCGPTRVTRVTRRRCERWPARSGRSTSSSRTPRSPTGRDSAEHCPAGREPGPS
ncbi:hypothetical protein [Frankia sp. EAN1pec]|uniref:hypothetical protein n=1 Tax=Parafrankia sp. (strain EAN1pec) TaxID=298653 RepID=UPI0012FBA69A